MSFYGEFAAVYEQVFPLRDAVVAAVTARLGSAPAGGLPARVLDVGCGPGHLCARLASAGHHCTGVDLDEAMIARGRELYPALDLRVLDLRRVGGLDETFDAALCLGNVLPHVGESDLEPFLAGLHECLAPGATWIVQQVSRDALAGVTQFDFPPLETAEGFVFERRYEDLDRPRCRFRTRLLHEGRELFAGEVPLTLVPRDELVERHAAAGFMLVDLAADFAGTPWDASSSRGLVAVFRRDLT